MNSLLILEKIAEGVLPIIAILLKDRAGEVRILEEYRDCYLKEALEIYEQGICLEEYVLGTNEIR